MKTILQFKKLFFIPLLFLMVGNVCLGQDVPVSDGFDYPFGSKGYIDGKTYELLEKYSSEKNNIYNSSLTPKTYRCCNGSTGGGDSDWHNYQDVGSWYSETQGFHSGEDWNKGSGEVGQAVYAVADGKVVYAGNLGLNKYGKTIGFGIIIQHLLPQAKTNFNTTTIYSVYYHLGPLLVKNNSLVKRGQKISTIGAITAFGPHLHFEMRANRRSVNDNEYGYHTTYTLNSQQPI